MNKTPRVWRRPLLLTAVLAFGLMALRSFVIVPLKVEFDTNIVYMSTVLPLIFDLLSDLLQMAVIYVSFAFVIETVFRQGVRRAIPVALLYLGAVIFGAGANLVIDLTLRGGQEVFGILLLSSVSGILQEFVQLVFVMLTAALLARRYDGPLSPIKLFSCKNRPQLTGLVAAGITMLFRVGARLIYDIHYGAPTSTAEIVDMIGGYGSDLLTAFLGYLGIVLLMMRHPDPTPQSEENE